jgi:hypothetical protein
VGIAHKKIFKFTPADFSRFVFLLGSINHGKGSLAANFHRLHNFCSDCLLFFGYSVHLNLDPKSHEKDAIPCLSFLFIIRFLVGERACGNSRFLHARDGGL